MERKRKSMIYYNNKRNNPYSLTYTHRHTSSYTTFEIKEGNNTIINKEHNINEKKYTHTHTPASEAKKARVTNFVVSRKKN